MDIFVVLSGFGFSRGSIDCALGEGLGVLQAGGDGNSVHGGGFLVFFPGGSGDVAPDYGFDGEDAQFAHLHGAVTEESVLGGGDGGGEGEG